MKVSSIRSRWAAVGAAVAVSLGAGGIGITHATTSSGEKPVYIPLDSPCRLADNRPAGIGPDASVTFDGWGTVGDCTLPTGTAGLALNVTAVDATQQTNLRFYPADTPVPGTANLNPTPGAPPIPNAVNVSLASADGKFKVYNRFGNVAVIIDVMGVYDDHNHDDRYYTEAEADAVHATKANSADVYTKTQSDAAFIPHGELVLSHSTSELTAHEFGGPTIEYFTTGNRVSGAGAVIVGLTGPAVLGGVEYGLKSVEYCINGVSGGEFVTRVEVVKENPSLITGDNTDRTANGCYVFEVNLSGAQAYDMYFEFAGTGTLRLAGIQSTWVPVTALPAAPAVAAPEGGLDSSQP